MPRDIPDYTQKYRNAPFEHIQVECRRKAVLNLIEKNNPTSLLEVGCGSRSIFSDLSPSRRITLIEPSEDFAKNAQKEAQNYPNTSVFCGFVEDFSEQQSFDMILLSSVLHECSNPLTVLTKLHALCDENTIVHVNVPNARSLHRELALAMGVIDDLSAVSDTQKMLQQHRPVYDTNTLGSEMEEAGFDVIESGGIFMKPFTHAQMQTLVDAEFMTSQMLEGFQQLGSKFPEMASEIWVHAKKKND